MNQTEQETDTKLVDDWEGQYLHIYSGPPGTLNQKGKVAKCGRISPKDCIGMAVEAVVNKPTCPICYALWKAGIC